MSSPAPAESPKSSRMIVSLQVGGIFFALANVICVAILAWTYIHVKLEPKTLEVKGSAKKAIQSDLITWSGTMVTRDHDLIKAYDKLKSDSDRVATFVKGKGIPDSEITFSSIQTTKIMAKDVIPQIGKPGQPDPPPLVVDSNRVELYVLTQYVSVESHDMKTVPELSRSITSLIKDDVEIDSGSPNYLYTKLSELKIDMLADATKDATTRATQIVSNANGKLGRLVEAKMGVMQINPKGSSATSSEGNNDTSSFEKEITAIVTARYELE
ncbi:MAG TPA: SIMPL domain-containing protein [Phycisphaerae bacterium]|jgi:hypothetical protein